MLPYFNNDRQLLLKTIQLIDYKIKKVGLVRRLYLRSKLFFVQCTRIKTRNNNFTKIFIHINSGFFNRINSK